MAPFLHAVQCGSNTDCLYHTNEIYRGNFFEVFFLKLYKAGQRMSRWMESLSVTFQMKAIEQYFFCGVVYYAKQGCFTFSNRG